MKTTKFIHSLCETFLRHECDPSKSTLPKNQKVTSAVHKDEDGSLAVSDKDFSINVVFEPEVLQDNLNSAKLKNIEGLIGITLL